MEVNQKKIRLLLLVAAITVCGLCSLSITFFPNLLPFSMTGLLFASCIIFAYLFFLTNNKLIISFLSIFFTLMLIDSFFAIQELRASKQINKIIYNWTNDPWTADDELTNWLKPNIVGYTSKQINQEFIYENVRYTTDELGRRKCPHQSIDGVEHALFFGGSFTFGEGVSDHQTLPCTFQALASGKYQAYNFALRGYGTGQMYWHLKSRKAMDSSIPSEGIAIYNFIQDHIPRTVGEFTKFTGDYSYINYNLFRIDPDIGELESYKLKDSKPLLYSGLITIKILKIISPTIRFLSTNFSFHLINDDYLIRTTAEVIIQSARMYHEQFTGQFIVLLWPRYNLDERDKKELVDLLNQEGILVIDVPPMQDSEKSQLHHLDPHPSALEYQWVAAYLCQEVCDQHR